jgi:hypothetical protein
MANNRMLGSLWGADSAPLSSRCGRHGRPWRLRGNSTWSFSCTAWTTASLQRLLMHEHEQPSNIDTVKGSILQLCWIGPVTLGQKRSLAWSLSFSAQESDRTLDLFTQDRALEHSEELGNQLEKPCWHSESVTRLCQHLYLDSLAAARASRQWAR